MSRATPPGLEETIRRSGEEWLIDWSVSPSEAMAHIRQALAAVDRQAKERLGGNAPELSEASLVHEYQKSPQRVRGFFQALGTTRTPEMLLMAWRVIQGMEIKRVELDYLRGQSFRAQVVLESPYGGGEETYRTEDINDFGLLRHFGILTIDGRPVFEGFYPMRLPR
jgi:hypothetical protein